MLVLGRNLGESVMIGDNVEVTVVGIRGNQVRLGFTAPSRVKVNRKEVWKLMKGYQNEKDTEGLGAGRTGRRE